MAHRVQSSLVERYPVVATPLTEEQAEWVFSWSSRCRSVSLRSVCGIFVVLSRNKGKNKKKKAWVRREARAGMQGHRNKSKQESGTQTTHRHERTNPQTATMMWTRTPFPALSRRAGSGLASIVHFWSWIWRFLMKASVWPLVCDGAVYHFHNLWLRSHQRRKKPPGEREHSSSGLLATWQVAAESAGQEGWRCWKRQPAAQRRRQRTRGATHTAHRHTKSRNYPEFWNATTDDTIQFQKYLVHLAEDQAATPTYNGWCWRIHLVPFSCKDNTSKETFSQCEQL